MKRIFCFVLILNITLLYSWDWPWADYTLDKRGVEITFPSEYQKDPTLGNSNFGMQGGFVESYTAQEKYGIFGINFILVNNPPKNEASLEDIMYAGIRSANGTFISKKFISNDGSAVLEYFYYVDYRSQGGPVIYMKEQLFRIDSYTCVNIKFVGTKDVLNKQEVNKTRSRINKK